MGQNNFCAELKNGELTVYSYSFTEWVIYKEPAITWDWDAPFMWGKNTFSEVDLLCKTSITTYSRINNLSHHVAIYTKKTVEVNFVPTTQPDNWKDYGLTEGDLK